ncbi:ferritin-like fold-containing protein [Microbacterium sp. 179-B 1A2 NHS]|uniref:ferritin-like fold-containing protein n=1 Tax=Microbacterium sp. 179-B 1A2 NHS TaxID=3142383 RepID=UPI0039A28E11
MVRWFWERRRPPGRILRLRSRDEASDVRRVDFEQLAPDVATYLGQAAYLQLGYVETLSSLIQQSPELSHKESLSRAAGAALRKHQALVALIRDRGDDPLELMLPFREPLDSFRHATHGARPLETMLTVHLTAGLLDDFYLSLSGSYGDTGRRVAAILRGDAEREALTAIVTDAISADAEWRALLSLWGRRLVGDTLLVARGALRPGSLDLEDEKQVQPVFTQLLGAHSRRMGALGLEA